jgi:hypothetical protein
MKELLLKTIKTYAKNPAIILFFILQYIFSSLFVLNSFLKFSSPITEYGFLIIFSIIFLLANSFFVSIFIGSASLSLKDKFSIKETLKFSKFTFKNLIIILVLLIMNSIVFYASNLVGGFLHQSFSSNFPVYGAMGTYILGLLIIVFFLFSLFFCTLKNESIFSSFKKSFISVKRNYLKIVFILLIYLLFDFLASQIPLPILKDIIHYILLYPLLALALTELFEKCTK